MIIFNLKAYSQLSGFKNLATWELVFTEILREFSERTDELLFAPEISSLLYWQYKFPGLNFVAQTIHGADSGAGTGKIFSENLQANSINYALLNHSEDRELPLLDKLGNLAAASGQSSEKLKLIVCCQNLLEARMLANLNFIYAVAFEPPELIGSAKSVTTEKPEIVSKFVEIIRTADNGIKPLVGAGISSPNDYQRSLELGADGVLLASAFTKSDDPIKFVRDFLAIKLDNI